MILLRALLYIGLVWFIAWIVPDIVIDQFVPTGVIVGLVFFIVAWVVRPVLKVITAPINLITLGLFAVVLNVVIFWLIGQFVAGFTVGSLLAAFIGSLLLSLGGWLIGHTS